MTITTNTPGITELPEDQHWWFATRTWSLLNLLDANVARRDGDILDIGCGAGNMIHHLSRYGRVKGIEVDARPVAMAQQRGYDVRQGDATRAIPFPDASFDLVTALDVIEHVDADEAILREAYRVARPRATLAISVPAYQWLWSYNDVLNGHKHRYTPRELRDRVARAGFRVKRITFGFFLVFPLSAPLIIARNVRGAKKQLESHHLDADAYQVEMEPTAPLVNTILRGIGRVEAALIARMNLPIGTSLMCVAEKVA
ncbi:MAG: class I SAM-dependent methyltransferase [Chloroflexi bacterium]|nr:class I SAM-dependent methyltransferase [Chloroflexota bacterium]